MRVTIFGSSGLLGNALMHEWLDDELTGLSSKNADIRDVRQVTKAVMDSRPDWIVLAAAYTAVDGCEKHPALAFDINVQGAVNVADAAKRSGARLLFLSSDYVFDGSKSAPYETTEPRKPINVYGRTKAQAEEQLLEILPNCCIVRTSWLFGAGGRCFPDTILDLARTRAEIEVVNDQRGCPTYNTDLARAIISLCRHDATGIVHVTNACDCTWFEFAEVIINSAGLKTSVRAATTEKLARPAARPKYSVLSARSLTQHHVIMPSWQDALGRYLSERKSPTMPLAR